MIKLYSRSSNFTHLLNLALKTTLPKDIVLFCIGTDKATGDCFAPLIGTMLVKKNIPCYVYGTLSSPITAKNIETYYAFVKEKHKGSKIFCIDASLTSVQEVGFVKFSFGGLLPGLAVDKNLGLYGDYSLIGNVDIKTDNALNIFKTPLGVVYEMAEKTADGIYLSICC